jgi:hypothetical protein
MTKKSAEALKATTAAVKRSKPKPLLKPSAKGLELLALIADQIKAGAVDWDGTPAGNRAERRHLRLCSRTIRLGRGILRRPVACMSDLVDRAILSCWWCQPWGGALFGAEDDPQGFHAAAVVSVLRAAGLTVAQCHALGAQWRRQGT